MFLCPPLFEKILAKMEPDSGIDRITRYHRCFLEKEQIGVILKKRENRSY